MKKICLLLVLISYLGTAQQSTEKKIEKIAKNATERMKIALSLNKEEEQKVYQIQVRKFEEILYAKEDHVDEPEIVKSIIRDVNKKHQKIFKNLFGETRFKKWAVWLRSNRKNVKTKKNTDEEKSKLLANKMTNKMVDVLKLNKEEKNKVYEIQFHKYASINKLKQTVKGKDEQWYKALKKINNDSQEQFRLLLGKERFRKWTRWNNLSRKKKTA